MTEDEMAGWHHQLNGHEFEQIPGDSEGQRSLVCYSPWGRKESDTTECTEPRGGQLFPVILYTCESWTVKKAECQRIDAFEKAKLLLLQKHQCCVGEDS